MMTKGTVGRRGRPVGSGARYGAAPTPPRTARRTQAQWLAMLDALQVTPTHSGLLFGLSGSIGPHWARDVDKIPDPVWLLARAMVMAGVRTPDEFLEWVERKAKRSG